MIGHVLAVRGAVVTAELASAALTGSPPIIVGDLIAMPAGCDRAFGIVDSLRKGRRTEDEAIAEVHLLGEITRRGAAPVFRRGVSVFPALGVAVERASRAERAVVYAQPSAPHVRVGRLRHDSEIPAYALTDGLLGKHFAVLGSTGSGKSCSVTVILRAILDAHPYAHVVIIDPHGEYGGAFGDRAVSLDSATLELPYWLLTHEEAASILASSGEPGRAYAEAAILRDAILRAKLAYAGADPDGIAPITVDSPVPYRLSDLIRIVEDGMGQLNKPEAAASYRHLLARIASVRDDRRYAFMFQSVVLRDTMEAVLRRLLRLPVEGKPVTVLDISGVPSEIVNVVVSLLCRVFFEFGLWSDRASVSPLLVVCEEAHRYVPADPALGFEPTRRAIDRIAKEGRKYGVSLCLVSQRPSELSPGSLSQCGTIFALRMSNDRDHAIIRNALPDGFEWMIRGLPALGAGEAVAVGEGVSVPMQVRFEDLPPDAQPASRTPSFSSAWSRERDDPEPVRRAIARWRGLQR